MKLKKILKPFVVALSLIVSIPVFGGTNTVSADEVAETRNVKIINDSRENFVYTYEEDGEKYKVIESSAENYSLVSSSIYKMDDNGKYKLDYTSEMKIDFDESKAYYTEYNTQARIVSTNTINIENMTSKDGQISFEEPSEYAIENPGGEAGWRYSGQTKPSTKILKYTISGVTAVLVGVAGVYGGVVGGTAAGILRDIAIDVVDEKIANLWYICDFYLLFKSNSSTVQGEWKITKVYKNSARTQQVGGTVSNYYYV